jgi:leucyl aminopeptidase
MKIDFASAALPDSGTLVVLAAADGTLGPVAADVDQRTSGALRRAIKLAGDKFKRGHALELLYPGGLEVERLVVLSLGKPAEASKLDLETLGGSLAVRLKGFGVSEAAIAVEAVSGLPVGPAELAVCLAAGAELRSYRFTKYRTRAAQESDDAENGEDDAAEDGLSTRFPSRPPGPPP